MAPNRTGSIRQRGKSYQARWQDPAGHEHCSTVPSRSAAERYLRDEVAAWHLAHDAIPTVPSAPSAPSAVPTFEQWADTWLADVAHLRPSSHARAASAVRAQLVPAFGSLPIDQITAADVRRWVARQVAAGSAPATVTRSLRVLGACLQVAADDGLIPANPARGIRPPAQQRNEQRFLTPAEVAALADAIDPRYQALIYLAAYGGLRIGEICGLRVGRVDLANGQVQVVEQIVEVAGRLHAGPPKTAAGRRTVPIPKLVCDQLAAHCHGRPDDAYVFCAPGGGPIRRTLWAARYFRPAAEAAGLAPLRIHDLRHTAVALWIAAGASTLAVTRWAGHSSSAFVLDRYGHLLDGPADTATARLDAMARAAAG